MIQEQQKNLVTLIIKNITLNKREVDSIQIQLNNTVLDYLTELRADRSLVDDLFKPFNTD